VNKPPKIDANVHVIYSDGERLEPRVVETVEPQPHKSTPKRKVVETSVETTPPPSKQRKKSGSKKRKQTAESSQPQKKSKTSSSSSPRAQANKGSEKKVKAASLDIVFGDPDIKVNYLSKWANKAIANGRQVNLDDMAARGQNLKPHFDAFGWTNFLSLKELQYARLTRAFYAATKFKSNCHVLVTLKGVSFKLTPEIICNLLHKENKGVHLYGDN